MNIRERAQQYLELAERATEGPWINNEIDPIHVVNYWGEKEAVAEVIGREAGTCADKEFIAASRTEAPYLAQKLVEAMGVIDLLMEAHKRRGATLTTACGDKDAVMAAQRFLQGGDE